MYGTHAQHPYALYALTRAVPVFNTFGLPQVSSLSSDPLFLLDRITSSDLDDAESPRHLRIFHRGSRGRSRNMRPDQVFRQVRLSLRHMSISTYCSPTPNITECIVFHRRHACQPCFSLHFLALFDGDAGCYPKQ